MKDFIPISQPSITQKEIDFVTDAVKSGWVSSLGEYINLFEKKFAEYCNVDYALTTSNGTTAIHLALHTLGVGPGDEVIIPDLTFIATANAVKYTGATPIFVDIDAFNLCMSPVAFKNAISKKTKAVIPVHLYGHPCDMDAINTIAVRNNIVVIEDAAEAIGASINNKRVGGLGFCGTFSFYGNKNITSGEGGMITTNDKEFYEKCLHLRDHAMSVGKRYWHDEIGFNYRITNLQAALGCAQLERVEELVAKRREIFWIYHKNLGKHPEIELNRTNEWAVNSYWQVCANIKGINEKDRDALMVNLNKKGVDTRPYFYPISDMPMYEPANTPVTHEIFQSGICLPTYYDISKEDIKYICNSLVELL